MNKLFKRDSKGVVREWSVRVSGDETVVTHGVVNGKMQEKRTRCKPKNVGKSNETTPEQQAELEAKALWTKQKERECYLEDLYDEPAYLQPMLARDATKVGHQIDWDAFDYIGQFKLDGIRAINAEPGLQSRKGTFFTAPQHILEAIDDLKLNNVRLDGEIFKMGLPLNQILSATRKENENTSLLQYHVFDLAIPELSFTERYDQLFDLIPFNHPVIKLVPIEYLHADKVKSTHDKYVQQGYEGLMIRQANALYGFGERPNTLFKYKVFKEEEFLVTGVVPDKHDKQGILVCEDKFQVRMRGTDSQRERYLSHPEEVIGKQCTVRFFDYTEFGIPQFPVGVVLT